MALGPLACLAAALGPLTCLDAALGPKKDYRGPYDTPEGPLIFSEFPEFSHFRHLGRGGGSSDPILGKWGCTYS